MNTSEAHDAEAQRLGHYPDAHERRGVTLCRTCDQPLRVAKGGDYWTHDPRPEQ